jgi:catechol 2,3-dioxygenase-like lactoylglutathione lyase family enzyme
MGVTLDHVQIAAPRDCEAEARRFFGDLIGLREVEKPEPLRERGGVWFEAGDRQFHVGVDPDFRPASKAHPAFSLPLAELDPLAGRLEDAGADVDWDANLPGRRRFYSRDPWGNRIEFLADRA